MQLIAYHSVHQDTAAAMYVLLIAYIIYIHGYLYIEVRMYVYAQCGRIALLVIIIILYGHCASLSVSSYSMYVHTTPSGGHSCDMRYVSP